MQPNSYKIQIPNPCSENWDAMTPNSSGRFCDSCRKNVFDFTSKTDEEIQNFVRENQGTEICGRFYNHQLQRIRIEFDKNILFTEIPFWQKFLVIVLVCFGPDLFGYDFAFAQTDTLAADTISVVQQPVDSLNISKADTLSLQATDSLEGPVLKDINKVITCEIGPTLGMIAVYGSFTPVETYWPPSYLDGKEITLFPDQQPEEKKTDTVAREKIERTTLANKPKAPKKKKEEPFVAVLPEASLTERTKRKES